MVWLFEQPLPILFIGAFCTVVLFVCLMQTGRKLFLLFIILAAAVTGGLLFAERAVTTPREEIRETIDQIASDVEQNEQKAILAHISEKNEATKSEARRLLAWVTFHEVKIKRNLEIEISGGWEPRRALAKFNVLVVVSDRTGAMNNQRVPRKVEVSFIKEGERWLVEDYQHENPISPRR